jgi:N-acetylglucosaminyldiphosphoundecaprenol N-acetyl-beta-D-mannosaminyltransferase
MSTVQTYHSSTDSPAQSLPQDRQRRGVAAPTIGSTNVWGVKFAAVQFDQSIQLIDDLIQHGSPSYFITANLHYLMLNESTPGLNDINNKAAFILADGMPIVWRSRFSTLPLPERIAGSDLIYALAALAEKRQYRVFFLGGAEGVAQQTADILKQKYPGFVVAGVETPPFRDLWPHEEADLANRIREARPDILMVALGQPRGEQWIHRWYQQMQIPVSVQLGGSFNFVTGEIQRSPKWIATIGMEWAHRLYCEPKRLGPRYWKNALFLCRSLVRDLLGRN